MLLINELTETERQKARIACAHVFSPKLSRSDEFLKRLDLGTLKKAYREKAKKYHPDLYRHEKEEAVNKKKECFIKIRDSYEVLSAYFPENAPALPEKSGRKGKIIAIGGAKGGIGKSLFAANLGVWLSNKGFRTVLVDLDLGGANLHLYLGETYLDWNVNDYLSKRVTSLENIMINNKYGPLLIGGDSSHLGGANINFLVKLKLLKALKGISADYVIIDLGGDTSYNILDFFLSADHGIVMTTCDPASYLDAYNFIKTALYRKLNRLFGSESKFRDEKDKALQALIYDATISANGSNAATIEGLIERVKTRLPRHSAMVSAAISDFNPYLLVNRVPDDFDVIKVVKRIKAVSGEMLSIKVGFLGSLPYQSEIELSARSLIPIVAKYPKGDLAEKIRRMAKPFLDHKLPSEN